jgi:hypothetical protein
MAIYGPVLSQYVSRFAPNTYAERIPDSISDAATVVQKTRRWRY